MSNELRQECPLKNVRDEMSPDIGPWKKCPPGFSP